MMLILIAAAALFYRNVHADIEDPDVSPDQARQIALSDAGVDIGDVTFTKTKLDSEEGILIYEIDFYTNERDYEYEINARTGAVRDREVTVLKEVVVENTETTMPEETAAMKNTGAEALIGVENAQKAALAEAGVPAGEVEFYNTSLETDDGKTLYEVKFIRENQEYEIEIDAYSGKVLKQQIRTWENEEEGPEEEEIQSPKTADTADAEKTYSDDDDDRDDDTDDDDDGEDRDDDDDSRDDDDDEDRDGDDDDDDSDDDGDDDD